MTATDNPATSPRYREAQGAVAAVSGNHPVNPRIAHYPQVHVGVAAVEVRQHMARIDARRRWIRRLQKLRRCAGKLVGAAAWRSAQRHPLS